MFSEDQSCLDEMTVKMNIILHRFVSCDSLIPYPSHEQKTNEERKKDKTRTHPTIKNPHTSRPVNQALVKATERVHNFLSRSPFSTFYCHGLFPFLFIFCPFFLAFFLQRHPHPARIAYMPERCPSSPPIYVTETGGCPLSPLFNARHRKARWMFAS